MKDFTGRLLVKGDYCVRTETYAKSKDLEYVMITRENRLITASTYIDRESVIKMPDRLIKIEVYLVPKEIRLQLLSNTSKLNIPGFEDYATEC